MLDARSVGHIVRNLGKVVVVGADETVRQAATSLKEHKVGCLVVADAEANVIGIVTERDIIKKAVAVSADATKLTVRDVMTESVICCTMRTPILEAQELMAVHSIRHLPVIEDGQPIGMISSRDIVAHQIKANRAMQAAAEQVALLSKGFKSLDFDEVLHLVTKEVPRIFGADWGVLCFPAKRPDDGIRVLSRKGCHCSEKTLCTELVRDTTAPIAFCDLPRECEELDAQAPRMIFRLPMHEEHVGPNQDPNAYLCMCRLSQSAENSKELLSYKATLLQEILSVNLMNARLFERARRDSQIDALTGVFSRRVFEDQLEQECQRSIRYGHPFAVAIVDVDRFKAVNDALGHAAGDQMLRMVADTMRQGIRTTDVLARYGGDEFVLLMPETMGASAIAVVERLRTLTGSALIEDDNPVTISCGVAVWSGDKADTSADVLRRADAALYEAKRTGRNRVVLNEADAVTA